MRWRQVYDEEQGKYVMVPMDAGAMRRDSELGIIMRGNFDAFRSPIDGELISNERQYRAHMDKHGVVPAAEFSQEFYAKKAKERELEMSGYRTPQQELRDKQRIYETIESLSRR